MTGTPIDLGPRPDDDHPADDDRLERLADQLAGIYDFRHMPELEKEDPERAQEHRDAAQELSTWLTGLPREERHAAFSRGWEKAKERRNKLAAQRITELEGLLAAAEPPADSEAARTVESWRQARQDPRFEVVIREALNLDRYERLPEVDGYEWTPVMSSAMAQLFAARVVTALLRAETATPPDPQP